MIEYNPANEPMNVRYMKDAALELTKMSKSAKTAKVYAELINAEIEVLQNRICFTKQRKMDDAPEELEIIRHLKKEIFNHAQTAASEEAIDDMSTYASLVHTELNLLKEGRILQMDSDIIAQICFHNIP